MKRVLAIIVSFLLIGGYLEAAEQSIEVRPFTKESFVTAPRTIVSTSVRVTNNTSQQREFILTVKLPEGWILITQDFPFILDPLESDIRLLSFFIPQSALAGKYVITYMVQDRESPSFTGLYEFLVFVLPLIKIQVQVFQAPEYVIAGESYEAVFLVCNESNTETSIQVQVMRSEEMPFRLDADSFMLLAGETKKVTLMLETEKDIQKARKENITLSVIATIVTGQVVIQNIHQQDETSSGRRYSPAKPERREAQASAGVEIIPRISHVEERYHRIPGAVTLRWANRKKEERESGFEAEVSGKGELSENGGEYVAFLCKAPTHEFESVSSTYDEYYLSYWSKDHELHFGDKSYSLSPLTEYYLYGRGVEGRQNFKGFDAKVYHLQTRRFAPEKEETGGYVRYRIQERHTIGINYLNKREAMQDAGILSLYATVKPLESTEAEMEYAHSSGNDAYWLNVSGYQSRMTYFLKYIHADPDYHGYYSDKDFLSGDLSFSVTNDLRLRGFVRRQKDNLLVDPVRGSSFLDIFYGLGCSYHLLNRTDLSLDWRFHDRKDQIPTPASDYQEDALRLGIGQDFRLVDLFASFELGRIKDRLAQKGINSEEYMLNISANPYAPLNVRGYCSVKNNGKITGEPEHALTTGVGFSYRIKDKTFLHVNYQSDDYQASLKDQDFFEIQCNHTLRRMHILSLMGRQSTYQDPLRKDEALVMAEYTIPFGVPIRRKKGIGGVKGRIYDAETQKPCPNVLLRLNGTCAVSDRSGHFFFPSVQPGTFYLSIDRTGIDPHKLPLMRIPMPVTVEGGKDAFIEIPVSRSGSLTGQVMLYQTEDGGFLFDPNQRLVQRGGLQNIILELSNGSDINRRVTDNEGRFEFDELQPGNWTLKVYEDNLPPYYHCERDAIPLELTPGQKGEILIKVLPKQRRIRFIGEGGVITEEGPDP